MRLTKTEAQALGVQIPTAPPRRRPRLQSSNGHQWHRDGRGLRCQDCDMWLPYFALAAWGHGDWGVALETTHHTKGRHR